jgi:osmoprotectant transport system ATP-binding protein
MEDPVRTAPNPPMLRAHGVDKRYRGGITALDGASLEVPAGETLALVGESGSGKSTLLGTFNRTVDPDAGEVSVEGRSVADRDPVELRRRIGYVPQDGGLIPHWPVGANVELVPRLLGWPADRRRRRSDEMLALVGLDPGELRERYPRRLSGGQRQRVALARALAGEPPVVLLDEPFGALDALTRLRVRDVFRRLRRAVAATLLLVTHDLEEAFELGDRVAVMKDGRVLQSAPPRDLLERPTHPYVEELLALRRGPT